MALLGMLVVGIVIGTGIVILDRAETMPVNVNVHGSIVTHYIVREEEHMKLAMCEVLPVLPVLLLASLSISTKKGLYLFLSWHHFVAIVNVFGQ
jgi:hypothetical protein